ncbi:MAG: YdbL family protein [Rhodospirillales bacterium]
MHKLYRLIAVAVLMAGLFTAAPVSAQSLSLQEAQARGYVGEKIDGYIGVVQNAPGVAALVDDINLQRRQLYRDIARKNNIPLATVERLAADKAINRATSGEYVQDQSGKWTRKP